MGQKLAGVTAALGSLRGRLTLAAVACITLAVLALVLLGLAQVERKLRTQAADRELQRTAGLAGDLTRRTLELQQSLAAVARTFDAATESDDRAIAERLLALPLLRQRFATIFVAAPDGRVRLIVDPGGSRTPDLNIADRPYFQRLLGEQRPVISEPLPGRVSAEPLIVMGHPIVRNGRVTAVLGGTLRLGSRSLAEQMLDTNGEDEHQASDWVVTDDRGRVIAHTRNDWLLKDLATDAHWAEAVADWRERGAPVEPSGLLLRQTGAMVVAAGVPGADWVVWQALPDRELLAPLRVAQREAMIHGALVLLAVGTGVWWLMGRQLRPLQALERRALTLFDPGVDIHAGWPGGSQEIESLARALRHTVAERAQLEAFSRELLDRLGSVMDAAPMGIAFTRNGRYQLVNPAWCELIGRSEHELVGAATRDSLAEPADEDELVKRVVAAFAAGGRYEDEWALRRGDGSMFWGQLCARPVREGHPQAGVIWTLADVSGQRARREALERSALQDPLTGLANRASLAQRLETAFANAQLPEQPVPAALLAIDLDHFKPVNDRHGHAAGDAMLQAVAQAISSQVRASDLVARTGGDEFAVMLHACPPPAAARIAQDIVRAVEAAFILRGGERLAVGASIGIAPANEAADVIDWQAAADRACYAAKAAGRGRTHGAPSSARAAPATPVAGIDADVFAGATNVVPLLRTTLPQR